MHFSGKNSATRLVLDRELDEFLIDREAQNLTANTLRWYRQSLSIFHEFVVEAGVTQATEITPAILRRFLIHLSDRGHSDGGIVNVYGAVKAFLKWYETEYEPAGWTSPLAKVKSPKRTKEVLQPLSTDDFQAMIRSCNSRTFTGARDQAVLMVLFDSGVRKQELCDLNVGDVDLQTGDVLVTSGKGRKTRITMVGSKTRRALAKYLRYRPAAANGDPLWVKENGDSVLPSGMRQIVRRCSVRAGVKEPGFHAFRRAFAINFLRNGGDLITLQRMLGHADLSVINRYLALVDEDIREAHGRHGPVNSIL